LDYARGIFTKEELDLLTEVASVGSGNAATALSQMVQRSVTLKLPTTKIIPVEKFPEQFPDPNVVVVGTYMEIFGEYSGEIVLFFPRKDAVMLGGLLRGKELTEADLITEMEESMFREIANIVCSAYINALSKMCDAEILPSVPHFSCDMLSAVIDFVLVKLCQKVDNALYVNASFSVDGKDVNGSMLVIFEEESLKKIIEVLRKKQNG